MKKKKFIISASRRTDIPAFFADWFMQKLQSGYCEVANPFNARQISKISLLPEDVEAFVFWTRNPAPFAKAITRLIELNYKFGFMITITGFPQWLEPGCPAVEEITRSCKKLARQIGKNAILWRYDPIIFSRTLNFAWHLANFTRLAQLVSPYTSRCIISFADFYRKTKKNLALLQEEQFISEPLQLEGIANFLKNLKQITNLNNIELTTCCETDQLLAGAGIKQAGCISADWLAKICGRDFLNKPHKGQRKNCLCIYSQDIGTYNTCQHGCKYCYATLKPATEISK